MSAEAPITAPVPRQYACTGCGAVGTGNRLPPKWKRMPAGPLCPECRQGYATRVISLPVRLVVEPAGTSLLDSLRDCWRLATDLANWCQLELLARDVRRTPDMERLPAYAVPSLYSLAIRDGGCPFAGRFAGCAGSAAAIIRECEQRWKGHPRFGRFAVLWRGESGAASYTYPYPWIVRAQEARLTREGDGGPTLSVTVPGGRNVYRLAAEPTFRRQLGQVADVLAGTSRLGDVKLTARWSGGRIVGVDARLSATMPTAARVTGQTAIVRTTADALLSVEVPDRSEPWLYHADHLRGVLAAYERWRHRAAVDLKHEKRWPAHTRRRIVAGMRDRTNRQHARMRSGLAQAAAAAVGYCARHGCGSIVYDDSDRGAVPGNFPWRALRERLSLTAANAGVEFEVLKGADDESES